MHRPAGLVKRPDKRALGEQNEVALKLLGCAIMRRSQRRWLFGAEAADTEFSEQRFSDLKCCAGASTLTRNFPSSSSSQLYLRAGKLW
jgi:hypothetical protein